MKLKQTASCDVLVLGSGIAGISAALAAAERGSRVVLACKGRLFSGSSFYPGTWGLGLIGPADEEDKADLAASIRRVGCDIPDPEMVDTFVSGIGPAIRRVSDMGVKLRRADKGGEQEYIPCFDHKHRDWNGIEFDSAREVFSRRLEELGVEIFPGCEGLALVKHGDRVCGAVVVKDETLCYLAAGAVVLATGGYGSLFENHLCTEDVMGSGHAMALRAGCQLVNMEFMQMMPGYLTPAPKTIFNEKTFRFTCMKKGDGSPLLGENREELLKVRSGHGPFTSRLISREVDFAMFHAFLEDKRGVEVTYSEEMKKNPPEFVKVYFDWLKENKGVSMEEPIHIAVFAHAANGGIKTAPDASTGVPGLFAAGEVTGGMHGADRIGGLSTANGLVFGTRAGYSAAQDAAQADAPPGFCEFTLMGGNNARDALKQLQETMTRSAMIVRTGVGLTQALHEVEALSARVLQEAVPCEDVLQGIETHRMLSRCLTAECILRSALMRTESRGSHYRADFPEQDDSQSRPIVIGLNDGVVCAAFQNT